MSILNPKFARAVTLNLFALRLSARRSIVPLAVRQPYARKWSQNKKGVVYMGIVELRAAYEERRLGDATALYEELAGNTDPEGHFWGGLAYWAQGRLVDSRGALETGLAAGPDNRMRLQMLLVLGETLRESGNIGEAVDLLQRFTREVELEPDLARVAAASGWYNLGLAYRQARRYADSIDAYHRAAAWCRREEMPGLLRMALQNLAWALTLAGELYQARAALDEAQPLCTSVEAKDQQSLGEAFLAATAGDTVRASGVCADLLRRSDALGAGILSHTYWVLGRMALASGDLRNARSLAVLAETHAEADRAHDSRTVADASDLLREILIAERGMRDETHHDGDSTGTGSVAGGGERGEC